MLNYSEHFKYFGTGTAVFGLVTSLVIGKRVTVAFLIF